MIGQQTLIRCIPKFLTTLRTLSPCRGSGIRELEKTVYHLHVGNKNFKGSIYARNIYTGMQAAANIKAKQSTDDHYDRLSILGRGYYGDAQI